MLLTHKPVSKNEILLANCGTSAGHRPTNVKLSEKLIERLKYLFRILCLYSCLLHCY